ncbi:hypothetical protein BJF84_03640 [Rhodococcus sp. CUA-806]|nr:hypothetical protein BJF84_03640 [Rhodococcus sp. CUA-806]
MSGAPTHWDPFPVGTGEGLNRTFAAAHKDTETGRAKTEFHCRSALFTVRDIGAFDALADRRGQTLVTELLKAAMGQEIGFTNATIEHRVILPAHSYRLGLTAGVQPGNGSTCSAKRQCATVSHSGSCGFRCARADGDPLSTNRSRSHWTYRNSG